MNYGIKLTIAAPSVYPFKGRDVFRVQITASHGENMPDEIFGHQKTLVDPVSGQQQDEFCFVCSPYDLSDYPANEPLEVQSPAFFRKSTIDVLLPSVTLAADFIASVQEQVTLLVQLMEQLDELETIDEVWIASSGYTTTTTTTPAP